MSKHDYWRAGEADCPKDIKASNGELWKLRCKRCGLDNPRSETCGPLMSEVEKQETWLPIESAPKDGTAILAAWRTGAAGEGPYAVDKLWWAGSWCEYNRRPTHWMPLPRPPAENGASSPAEGRAGAPVADEGEDDVAR